MKDLLYLSPSFLSLKREALREVIKAKEEEQIFGTVVKVLVGGLTSHVRVLEFKY